MKLTFKLTLVGAVLATLASPVLAANAEAPNKNVDKTNDQGGPTGDDKTDHLNKAQQQPNPPAAPPGSQTPAPTPAPAPAPTK